MNNSSEKKVLIPLTESKHTEVLIGAHVYISVEDARAMITMTEHGHSPAMREVPHEILIALQILNSLAKAVVIQTGSHPGIEQIASKYYSCDEHTTVENLTVDPTRF
jgi:hypothetical protein